jgi:voltage-dependent calcium channel L type alpha-1D
MAALPMLGNTLVLMGVLLYMFTIMGMELFGGKMDFPEGKPRFHYDTLWQAFVSVFNVLGIENWHAALYPAVRALGTRAAALFYVGIIIILNCTFMGTWPTLDPSLTCTTFLADILLNLFISILLDQFGEAAQSDREEQQKKDESAVHQQFVKQLSETVEEPTAQSFARQLSDDAMDRLLDAHADGDNNDSIALLHPSTAKTRNKTNHAPLHGKSLLLFPPHSKLRQTLAAITSHAIFDAFITIIILGSCAALIAETSHVLSTNNQMKAAYLTVDIILMVIFGLEFIFKIIAYGLVGHKGSYLRNGWNVIDFLTVIALAVVLISSGAGANLRFLRSFMALRPLRLLSRFRSTRVRRS